jgi:hypothetical protein
MILVPWDQLGEKTPQQSKKPPPAESRGPIREREKL